MAAISLHGLSEKQIQPSNQTLRAAADSFLWTFVAVDFFGAAVDIHLVKWLLFFLEGGSVGVSGSDVCSVFFYGRNGSKSVVATPYRGSVKTRNSLRAFVLE